ncbi:sensor histidine kinase [Clostridium tagluense]|uniref:sensor histidine kinase n=1 Tax=Clostridium tagluense TaxID=360422 RepID=UPI001CF0FD2B|nr:HAMP domain-containing sensor histidine kinase [Clostridium tagluense]MCB2297559.1 HAMP domain-containing histidine kinase [Clostridium tagluense]
MELRNISIYKFIDKIKNCVFYDIPIIYREDFDKKILQENNNRTPIVCLILIFVNLIQLLFQTTKTINNQSVIVAYRNLNYICLLTILFSAIYLLRLYTNYLNNKSIKFSRRILVIFVFLNIILGTITSINAQLYQGEITGYIVAMFCFSIPIILNPKEYIIIHFTNFIILIIGLKAINLYPFKFYAQLNNAFVTMLLAIILSIMNYNFSVKNYIQKKEIYNKAIEYEKLRSEFFANISHELRTPLNVIFCAQQMLDMILKTKDSEINKNLKTDKYLHTIKQNSYRLLRLINNLIDITKMDAGYFEVNLSNNDIVKVVEDITLSVAEYVENKNINLIFDTETEEKIIACDPDKIERIILNLLSNAIKFTPSKGYIYVNIYDGQDKTIISVKDTGIGIKEDMEKLIFQRFIQVDKSTSRNREGSGIGLSLVKSLVELHNGKIDLITSIGNGSEFIIELPNAQVKTVNTNPENLQESKNNKNLELINLELSDIYF